MDLDKLMGKHLTRYFDPSRTIPAETLQQLLKFLRSTPTSTNIQPNHFYVLATDEGKKRLADNLGDVLHLAVDGIGVTLPVGLVVAEPPQEGRSILEPAQRIVDLVGNPPGEASQELEAL